MTYDRAGQVSRAIVSLLCPSGARRLASTDDADVAGALEAADPLGATVNVDGHVLTVA